MFASGQVRSDPPTLSATDRRRSGFDVRPSVLSAVWVDIPEMTRDLLENSSALGRGSQKGIVRNASAVSAGSGVGTSATSKLGDRWSGSSLLTEVQRLVIHFAA
jgi:hypothetical protein